MVEKWCRSVSYTRKRLSRTDLQPCGATYIIGEIIAKDNLNIENLMQTFENLFPKTARQNS